MKTYTSPEAVKLSGVSYRMLEYWDLAGYVSPTIRPATGSGSRRLYSERDVEALRILKALRDAGLEMKAAVRMLEGKRGPEDLIAALERLAVWRGDTVVIPAV